MLPELLYQIPLGQEIAIVTADDTYDTRMCHDAIVERGAASVIPHRKNAKFWKADSTGANAGNDALPASNYLGAKPKIFFVFHTCSCLQSTALA